jgi:cytochrome c biogenesis protein CcdA/peroxiredoxin
VDVTIWLAFIAGIVSFVSPCVLPLVPAYIGYMGGRVTQTVAMTSAGQIFTPTLSRRFSTVMHGVFFVAGFTFVFVSLGLLGTAFVSVIGGQNVSAVTGIIGRLGGVMIIFFGLHFMGVLPSFFKWLSTDEKALSNSVLSLGFALVGAILIVWGFTGTLAIWDAEAWRFVPIWSPALALIMLAIFLLWLFLGGAFTQPKIFWTRTVNAIQNALYADTRRQMQAPGQNGYAGSALMGVVFSAGWTPCIGPVYGAVLTLAANGGDVAQAGILLAFYSLGLGIPFLLTAFLLDGAQGLLRRLQRHMHTIELASGAFLILIGVLVASGQLQSLSQQFANSPEFVEFSIGLEESVIGLVNGNAEQSVAPVETTPESAISDLILTNPETAQEVPTEATESAVASILELAANSGPSVGIGIGNIAPEFETVTDSGQPVRLSDMRGKVVLLNFWWTGCPPCRVEMPAFETIYNERKDEGFTVLAVNRGEQAGPILAFREELGVTFPMLLDTRSAITASYNVQSYPSSFLIDENGVILARHYGALTAEKARELVDEALAA